MPDIAAPGFFTTTFGAFARDQEEETGFDAAVTLTYLADDPFKVSVQIEVSGIDSFCITATTRHLILEALSARAGWYFNDDDYGYGETVGDGELKLSRFVQTDQIAMFLVLQLEWQQQDWAFCIRCSDMLEFLGVTERIVKIGEETGRSDPRLERAIRKILDHQGQG